MGCACSMHSSSGDHSRGPGCCLHPPCRRASLHGNCLFLRSLVHIVKSHDSRRLDGAYVEAKVRKPPVSDFRKIYEAENLTDMAKIPLFRVVLVAALRKPREHAGYDSLFYLHFPVLGIDPASVISTGFQKYVGFSHRLDITSYNFP